MGENLDLVREAFAAFREGGVEPSLSFAHPDVISVRHHPLPDPQTYHGIEGVLQMYADWTASFDEIDLEPLEFGEHGDRVFVHVNQTGKGKASGAEVGGRFWLVYTVADGRVTRMEAFLTKEQALAAG